MITIAIILFLAVLFWDIYSDYNKWLSSRVVKHTKEAWLRILLLSPSIILFTCLGQNKNWTDLVYTLVMEFFIYWTFFDGFYNISRGFNFWYTGTNDKDDAKTDNFLQSIPLWLHKTIKIGGCIVGIFLYLKNYL